jgi:hypothetical protein
MYHIHLRTAYDRDHGNRGMDGGKEGVMDATGYRTGRSKTLIARQGFRGGFF